MQIAQLEYFDKIPSVAQGFYSQPMHIMPMFCKIPQWMRVFIPQLMHMVPSQCFCALPELLWKIIQLLLQLFYIAFGTDTLAILSHGDSCAESIQNHVQFLLRRNMFSY